MLAALSQPPDAPTETSTVGAATVAHQAAPPSSSVSALLSPAEAVARYTEYCQRAKVSTNRHVMKLLLLGEPVYDFGGGYLGQRGIAPVMQTLAQVGVTQLSLRDCALETEDVRVVCAAFDEHPRLASLDLRENVISDAAAKLLIRLLQRNHRIRELTVDPTTPRYLKIQRLCVANTCGRAAEDGAGPLPALSMAAGTCTLCGVAYTQDDRSSATAANVNLFLSTLLNHFARAGDSASAAGVEVLFRLVTAAREAGEGVLFLCSDGCAERLALDLLQATRYVLTTVHDGMPCTEPQVPVVRAATQNLVRELRDRQLPLEAFTETPASVNAEADFRLERYLDEVAPGHHELAARCGVCGTKTNGLPSGPAQLLSQLRQDLAAHPLAANAAVGEQATLSLSAVLARICRALVAYAHEPVCSRVCVRDVVRYALYGYGGVLRVPPPEMPLLSSIAQAGGAGADVDADQQTGPLLPLQSFSIVDFAAVKVDDVGEEDIICALTVASAMEDIDGVPIDPYFLHAMARHIGGQPSRALGAELACACEAARVVGCLAQSDAPLQRRRGDRPSTSPLTSTSTAVPHTSAPSAGEVMSSGTGTARGALVVAEWSSWGQALGQEAVQHLLNTAFARRRRGLYAVDGPHGNIFDNIRAALWRYRNQRRSVLVAMEFAVAWLTRKDGLIDGSRGGLGSSAEMTEERAEEAAAATFLTTVKVVGQSVIANATYLILQGSFGPSAGNRGFFYVDKSTFVCSTRGRAYMFVDVPAATHGSDRAEWLASTLVPPRMLALASGVSHVRVLLRELTGTRATSTMPEPLRRALLEAVATISGDGKELTPNLSASTQRWQRYLLGLLESRGTAPVSRLLFAVCEIYPAGTAEWLSKLLQSVLASYPSLAIALLETVSAAIAAPASDTDPKCTPSFPGTPDELTEQTNGTTTTAGVVSEEDAPTWVHVSCPSPMIGTASRENTAEERPHSAASSPTRSRDAAPAEPPRTPTPRSGRGSARATRTPSITRGGSAGSGRGGSGGAVSSQSAAAKRRRSVKPPSKDNTTAAAAAASSSGAAGKGKGGGSGRSPAKRTTPASTAVRPASAKTDRSRAAGEDGHRGGAETAAVEESVSATGSPKTARTTAAEAAGGESAGSPQVGAGPLPVAEPVPPHLVGRPWSLVHVMSADGEPGPYVAAFIGDHVCVYQLPGAADDAGPGRTGTVLMPLAPIAENPVFMTFPFATGFDCAFHHPQRPREIVFIAGALALVWDAFLHTCVDGPFPLTSRSVFQRIPTLFGEGDGGRVADCAVPVADTAFVVFFAGAAYRVYDMAAGRAVSPVLQLVRTTPVESSGAPERPVDALSRLARAVAGSNADQSAATGSSACLWTAAHPLLGDDVVEHLPRSPLTSLWRRSGTLAREGTGEPDKEGAQSIRATLALVTAEDVLLELQLPCRSPESPHGSATVTSLTSVSQTALAGLPAVFHQCTAAALPALCTAALGLVNHVDTAGLAPFVPAGLADSGASTAGADASPSITSSLTPTEAGQHSLLALLSLSNDMGKAGGAARYPALLTCRPAEVSGAEASIPRRGSTPPPGEITEAARPPLATGPPVITLDLGEGCYESLRGVVLVLDTARVHPAALQAAPIAVGVAVSEDGVLYRELTHFVVGLSGDGAVTAAAWHEDVHATRYWQLRFLTDLPPGVGVVKTLWYGSGLGAFPVPAPLDPGAALLELLHPQPLLPTDAPAGVEPVGSTVVVDAPVLLDEPAHLLGHLSLRPVFAAAGPLAGGGWHPSHAAVPLLCSSDAAPGFRVAPTCLLLCDGAFVEFDLVAGDVVDHRVVVLAEHPAFRALPPSFARGLQAAFYLDPATHPQRVSLLSNGWVMEWDLSTGQAVDGAAGPTRFDDVAAFEDVPMDLAVSHELVAIVNDWTAEDVGELLLLFKSRSAGVGRRLGCVEVVRWHPVRRTARGAQQRLLELDLFKEPLSSLSVDAELHTLLMPTAGSPLVVFADEEVVVAQAPLRTTGDGKVDGTATAPPSRGLSTCERLDVSRTFHALRRYLPAFASVKQAATVTLDLREAPLLALGLELVSAHAAQTSTEERWQIAFSDDGQSWVDVRTLTHSGHVSRTTWAPARVHNVSHRFWRCTFLGTQTPAHDTRCAEAPTPALYTQVRLLTLAEDALRQPPIRIRLSPGCQCAPESDVQSLFSVNYRSPGETTETSAPPALLLGTGTSRMILDYGRLEPELCGFVLTLAESPPSTSETGSGRSGSRLRRFGLLDSERWIVEYSADAASWVRCGCWQVPSDQRSVRLSWAPQQPSQYWRLTREPSAVDAAALTLTRVAGVVYAGPSVSIRRAGRRRCSSPDSSEGWRRSLGAASTARPDEACAGEGDLTYVTSLIAFTPSEGDASPSAVLPIAVGSTITVDTKSARPAAVAGMVLRFANDAVAIPTEAARVEFLAEFSTNGTHWYAAATMLYFAGQAFPVHARWGMVGSYRFWRLRVVHVSGSDGGELRIQSVQLLRAAARLYRSFLSQRSEQEPVARTRRPSSGPRASQEHRSSTASAFPDLTTPSGAPVGVPASLADSMNAAGTTAARTQEMVYLRLSSPQPLVRVFACVPPRGVYAVERLSHDGSSWECVGTLHNPSAAEHRELGCSWPRGAPSSTWRLRAAFASVHVDGATNYRLRLPVTWFAFARERAVPAALQHVEGLDFTHSGFVERAPGERLFCGVLPGEPVATVLYAGPTVSERSLSLTLSATSATHPPRREDPHVAWRFPAPVRLHFVALKGAFERPVVASDPAAVEAAGVVTSPSTGRASLGAEGARRRGGSRVGSSSRSPVRAKASKGKRTTSKVGSSLAEAAEAAASAVEASPVEPVILVETSDNGIDFVALASASLVGLEGGKTLSWVDASDSGCASAHWRIRFEGVPGDGELHLSSTLWSTLCGVPGIVEPHDTLVMDNGAYALWQEDTFNREAAFVHACQEGFDQARSRNAKLREEDDLSRAGSVADSVWRMKKRVAAFVGKVSKDAAQRVVGGEDTLPRSVPSHLVPFLATGSDRATDLLYFLAKVADRYPEADVLRLAELVASPVNLGKGLTFAKREGSAWFYPNFSIYGGMKGDDFHGMDPANVSAAFSVYWSQSIPLQRNCDVLLTDGPAVLSDLSPHVASPFLVFYWEHKKSAPWSAAECFPDLPALAFAGFGSQSVSQDAAATRSPATMMVCALNDLPFSQRYPLSVGEGGAARSLPPPVFPFRVCAGVNFVQVSTLPPFLADTLAVFYEGSFLATYRTTIVFTAPSLSSQTCQLRFTLPASEGGRGPGGAVTLGVDGIAMTAITFEVHVEAAAAGIVARSRDGSVGGDTSPPAGRVALRRRRYAFDFHVNIISRGATYTPAPAHPDEPSSASLPEGTSPTYPTPATVPTSVAVSILGNLSLSSNSIPLRLRCANVNLPLLAQPDVVLTQLDISVALERLPDSRLRCPPLSFRAAVNVMGSGRPLPCAYALPNGQPWNAAPEVHVDLLDMPLSVFVPAARVLAGVRVGDTTAHSPHRRAAEAEWLAALPIRFVSATVTFDTVKKRIHGTGGRLAFYGATADDVTVSVTEGGIMLAGSVASARVGNMVLETYQQGSRSHRVDFTVGDVHTLRAAGAGRDLCAVTEQSLGTGAPGGEAADAVTLSEVLIHVRGHGRLMSSSSLMPISLEVSQGGALCVGSVGNMDVTLVTRRDVSVMRSRSAMCRAVNPPFEAAKVAVNSDLLLSRIARAISRAPAVRTLQAHGLPFSFTPQDLAVLEPMLLSQRRISVVLRGIFFGNWFEVFTTVTELTEAGSESSVDALCEALVTRVLEENVEAMWKSYANVAGVPSAEYARQPHAFLTAWQDREREVESNRSL